MNYALIGCGRIAKNHIRAAMENGWNIAAVCDVLPERMAEVLQKNNAPVDDVKQFTDYREMLRALPDIDVVSIAAESGKHAEIALRAIAAKKNVIIEKPMAMSIADADKIIVAAKENGVKVAACHQNRFNIAVQKTRQAIEAGRFGKISHGSVHVRCNRNKDYYAQAPWRGTWEEDGGALMNQCIHGIDLLRWLMGGKVTSVYGQTRRRFHDYLEAEDVGLAVLTFADGSIGTVEGTTNVFPQNLEETLYIFGEKGAVKLGGKSTNHIDLWQFADEMEGDAESKGLAEATDDVYGNGHARLFADMAAAIRENRVPMVDAQAGKDALETVLAIYKSQHDGGAVTLPLKACASTDFAGMFDKK